MAYLWGTVVLASSALNAYLSLPPILNMIRLDRGIDSIVQAVRIGDVALIASLTNAVVAAALLLMIVARRWISGESRRRGAQYASMNGHGNTAGKHTKKSSSEIGTFTVLCIGLAGGCIASNALLVHRHVRHSNTLHERYTLALEEAAAAQRMLSSAHQGAEQCRVDAADVRSELNGRLAAREATIDTYSRAASGASALRSELDQVRRQLKDALAGNANPKQSNQQATAMAAELESKAKLISYLKSEMTAMGERYGVKIGEIENSVFEAQENRRRVAVEKSKLEKELEEMKTEMTRLQRSQDGLERKLKREAESHATTMDEYSRTVVRLGDLENAVNKFLKGGGNDDELRKLMG